jgi:DNA-directed RNA polymerase specialized sigma24 family protein
MNLMDQFDEHMHLQSFGAPESIAIAASGRAQLKRAPETAPCRFSEVLVLRKIKPCSYKELTITSIPSGTVMSSLSRARLQLALSKGAAREAIDEL